VIIQQSTINFRLKFFLKIDLVIGLILLTFITACSTKNKSISSQSKNENQKSNISEEAQTKFAFYFVDGCKERMKGNIEIAENLFRECLKIDPSSAATKYELGNIYRYSGLYDEAIKYGRACANEDPKNKWYQLLYIECLSNKRQYNAAAEVYTRLIKNHPNTPEFYEGLAAQYMYAGNYEKAYKTYDEIEKQFGYNDAFTLNKIKILKEQRKFTEVENEFKKLIENNKQEIRYYTYLADFYQETAQNNKAFDTYQEALKIAPNDPLLHLALADYYKFINDKENFFNEVKIAFKNPDLETEVKTKILSSYYEISEKNETLKNQADTLFNIALKLHPGSSDLHGLKGDFLIRDEKVKEAHEEYLLAIKSEKGNFELWNQLLITESELGEYKLLEENSSSAIELFPNQPLPYFFNGLANSTLKNYTKAIESLNEGLEFVYENNALMLSFYSTLGDCYNANKDFEKSDKAFDNALKIDPDNASILNNYAYYLSLRKEKLDKAEKYSKRSNELKPNNVNYIDTYGWILFQQSKYNDAEVWLNRAVKISKKGSIAEHYGDVLFKLGKKDEALIYWNEAQNTGGGSEFLNKKIETKTLND
jgi:tetratricopeptide (TPR) repeat protein